MSTILIVEDDPAIANLIALYLEREGHQVIFAPDGPAAVSTFERDEATIDLIILDLMLPGLDGRGVCRRIRDRSTVPIIMVTALDDSRTTIEGLNSGADDYVTKPFDPKELVARVQAVLRRSQPHHQDREGSGLTRIGNLTIDPGGYQVTAGNIPLSLSGREFDLLLALASNANRVLTRQYLAETIWNAELPPESRTIDVHISRLRDKLDAASATVVISSMRGVGYRLTLNEQ